MSHALSIRLLVNSVLFLSDELSACFCSGNLLCYAKMDWA